MQVENQSFEFDCILKVLFISKSLMMSAPHMPAKMCQLDNLYITVLSHIIKVYKSDKILFNSKDMELRCEVNSGNETLYVGL